MKTSDGKCNLCLTVPIGDQNNYANLDSCKAIGVFLCTTSASNHVIKAVTEGKMANIQHAVEAGSATMQTKIAYTAGVSGLGISALTINNMVGISVGIVSIITMIWAAYSNHKKNKLQMELLRKQIGDRRGADTGNDL